MSRAMRCSRKRAAFFIVRVELFALADDSLIERMRNAPGDLNHNGLGHLVRDHMSNFFILVGFFCWSACFGVRHGSYPLLAFLAAGFLAAALGARARLETCGEMTRLRSLACPEFGLHATPHKPNPWRLGAKYR